jgi:adenylate cyclase
MSAVMRDAISGEVHPLGDISLIGRGDTATIRLADASVSRQHAAVRYEASKFWVVDLGSANGTFVNGAALNAARVLHPGDRLQVGKAVLVFEDTGSASMKTEVLSDRTQISRLPPEPARSAPMTILVGDLKGFTAICALLSPGQVADLLREWYADCDAILKRHGASIDKFIGDCVFAYWHGVGPDIRSQALKAAQALRIVEETPASPTRVLLRAGHGIAMDCRIGLHLGPVAIGSMGKGINTALGDAVNVAFRIEGLTRLVDEPILMSAAFVDGFPGNGFRSCGRHEVKGVEEAIEVFAPAPTR